LGTPYNAPALPGRADERSVDVDTDHSAGAVRLGLLSHKECKLTNQSEWRGVFTYFAGHPAFVAANVEDCGIMKEALRERTKTRV
jgi:hypothetical protein